MGYGLVYVSVHQPLLFGGDMWLPGSLSLDAVAKEPFTHLDRDWVYGIWYCGTSFQKAIYYGQYPATFVKRVLRLFPKCDMLHLCCGRCHIDGALNVDIKPLPEVDLVANVETRLPRAAKSFDVILIDPPYSQEDSKRYKVPRLVRSNRVMKEARRLLRPNGWLLWLDEKYPSYRRAEWRLRGLIAIITGFNRRTRVLSMWQPIKYRQST
jgi:SAM-dependent methyltransferase